MFLKCTSNTTKRRILAELKKKNRYQSNETRLWCRYVTRFDFAQIALPDTSIHKQLLFKKKKQNPIGLLHYGIRV